MKKLLLISMLVGAMPLAMMAQDDDLYFVSKKNVVWMNITAGSKARWSRLTLLIPSVRTSN